MSTSPPASPKNNPSSPPASPKSRSMFGGGGVLCQACGKTAYPAELVTFDLMNFHRPCFKCSKCSKKIEQAQAAKYDNKVYCRACFDHEGFARKQMMAVGQWQRKASSPTNSGAKSSLGGGGVPCATCAKTVYLGEMVNFETKVYHRECLKCSDCGLVCTINNAAKFEEKVMCRRCFDKNGCARKQMQVKFVPRESKQATGIFGNLGGGGEKCCACSKTVYPAELVLFETKNYHTHCFKCEQCKAELKVAQAEHKGPTPYCKKCYYALGLNHATLTPTKAKPAEAPVSSAAAPVPAATTAAPTDSPAAAAPLVAVAAS